MGRTEWRARKTEGHPVARRVLHCWVAAAIVDVPLQQNKEPPGMSAELLMEIPFRMRGQVDQDIFHEVWQADVYRIRQLAAALPGNPAERTIVDIGAHIGAFAVLAATTWPGCRLIACECDADNLMLLKENLKAVCEKGVGPSESK